MIDQLIAREVIKHDGIVLGIDDNRSAGEYVYEVYGPDHERVVGEAALQDEIRRFQIDDRTPGQLQAANLTANVRPHTV